MFDKFKKLHDMQKKASHIKKQLKDVFVEAEENGIKILYRRSTSESKTSFPKSVNL